MCAHIRVCTASPRFRSLLWAPRTLHFLPKAPKAHQTGLAGPHPGAGQCTHFCGSVSLLARRVHRAEWVFALVHPPVLAGTCSRCWRMDVGIKELWVRAFHCFPAHSVPSLEAGYPQHTWLLALARSVEINTNAWGSPVWIHTLSWFS